MTKTIRQKAEALLKEDYSVEDLMADNDLPEILHELRVHQIELELQNDELRRTQQELQSAQKKYFDLYNFAPVGYFTFNTQGIIAEVNLTGAKLLQRDRKRLIGKPFLIHLDSKTRPLFFEHLDLVFQTKNYQSCELTLQKQDGTKTYLHVKSIAAQYEEQWHCRSILSDITALRQTEADLAAEKERLRVTLQSIGDGVIAIDTASRITFMNHVAEQLTGWPQHEAVGRLLPDVFYIINELTGEPYKNPLEQALQTGQPVALNTHTILIAKDGSQKLVADSGAPIYDVNHNIIGGVLVFRDVTKKRKLAEELSKTQKLESIGVLAGGIAHDFNNILTGILGNVSMAKIQLNPESPIYDTLVKAENASLRARDLTQQLLTFARGGSPIKETVSLNELITTSVSFAVRGSNILPKMAVAADLWPVEIDSGQINQVLNNLIINAEQSMPAGGTLTVAAENIELTGRENLPVAIGKYVKITVQDEGTGISQNHLSKIFDPYFTTKETGNGLGLATTYSIIENHDGYLHVVSKVNVGSTFSVYLPASKNNVLPDSEAEPISPLSGLGRILVMDDEELIRDFLGKLLSKLGYGVSIAKSGEEAISLYQQAFETEDPFRAVIMDLTIPGGMGGKETIHRLLQIDPHVKAIVSSGYSNDPVMSNYEHYGFKGVILKPYQVNELSQCLHTVLKE